jgi:hypothetical protein
MHKKGAALDSLSEIRWEFLIRCWEYNIRIWRETFLDHRIQNPILFNAIKKIGIPYAAKMTGFYYGLKRGDQMRQAFRRMANA